MLPARSWRLAGGASLAPGDQPPERDPADERGQRRRRHGLLPRRALELLDHRADATAARGRRARRALGRSAAVAVTAADRACLLALGDQFVLFGKRVALELVGLLAGPRLDVGLGGQRLDRVAELLARVLDFGAQLLRALLSIVFELPRRDLVVV